MQKKTVLFGSVIVLVAAGLFLMVWRMKIMGPDAQRLPGGLAAVDKQGTPIPIPPAQATARVGHEDTAFQAVDGMLVSLALSPYPPSMGQASDFLVTLSDEQGRALTGATVSVDLTMPGMYMPPNAVTLVPAGTGMYQGSGRFSMRGPWRMEVIITIDGQSHSAFFDVWL